MDELKEALGFFQDLINHLEYHFNTTQYDIVTVVDLENACNLWLHYNHGSLFDVQVRVLRHSEPLSLVDFLIEVREGSRPLRFQTYPFMLADLGLNPIRINGPSILPDSPALPKAEDWIEELPHG